VKMQQNMDARCDRTPRRRTPARGDPQGHRLQEIRIRRPWRRDEPALQVGGRIVTDGDTEPKFEKDPELHYQPTSWAGARLPHAWVFTEAGGKASTLDLTGKGKFTILTGIGGDGWVKAAKTVGNELGIDIATHTIGPRETWQDYTGDWARAREVRDSGAILVRPDHHVAWRSQARVDNPEAELLRVFKAILDR
jgi:2,4-dichlorophenol 6-monooxygenase